MGAEDTTVGTDTGINGVPEVNTKRRLLFDGNCIQHAVKPKSMPLSKLGLAQQMNQVTILIHRSPVALFESDGASQAAYQVLCV